MRGKKRLQLYVHIPFCQKKCRYCDFLSAPADERRKNNYMVALQQEIRLQSEAYKNYSVPSVFIGGGTPSVFGGETIARLLGMLDASFFLERDAEITIECNPGTLNLKKAAQYKQAGINRISLGLQSAKEEELRLLGRIHTFGDFLESYDAVRKAGFDNVNVDLMWGLPMQTLSNWQTTLQKTMALKPEHLSAYSLIIEEGTPFYESYAQDEGRRANGGDPLFLPGEDTEREMYEWTNCFLEEHGYLHYEISNYAREGRECRHNIGYWRRENYLGLGLGSASLVENERFSNTRDLERYLMGDLRRQERQKLSEKEQMEEFMFLGLRMLSGVSLEEFREAFRVPIEGIYGDVIPVLCRQGLLQKKEGRLFLTDQGIAVSNYVMAQFLQ